MRLRLLCGALMRSCALVRRDGGLARGTRERRGRRAVHEAEHHLGDERRELVRGGDARVVVAQRELLDAHVVERGDAEVEAEVGGRRGRTAQQVLHGGQADVRQLAGPVGRDVGQRGEHLRRAVREALGARALEVLAQELQEARVRGHDGREQVGVVHEAVRREHLHEQQQEAHEPVAARVRVQLGRVLQQLEKDRRRLDEAGLEVRRDRLDERVQPVLAALHRVPPAGALHVEEVDGAQTQHHTHRRLHKRAHARFALDYHSLLVPVLVLVTPRLVSSPPPPLPSSSLLR